MIFYPFRFIINVCPVKKSRKKLVDSGLVVDMCWTRYNCRFSLCLGGLEKPKDTGVANLLSAMAKCAKLTPKSTSMAAADSAHH